MSLISGVKFHTNWVEVDMRLATVDDLEHVREYVTDLPGCAEEAWPDSQVLAICGRAPEHDLCKRGQHGYYHALSHDQTDVAQSLERSLRQESNLT